MIPFLDAAMVGWIKARIIEYPVIYAAPETSRQSLADYQIRKAKEEQSDEHNLTGLPGATVLRTGLIDNPDMAQGHQRNVGWIAGRNANNDYVRTRTIPRIAEYTVVYHAKSSSTMANMERAMATVGDYAEPGLTLNVRDENNQPIAIPIRSLTLGVGDPQYSREVDPESGRILVHTTTQIITVQSWWIDTDVVPEIRQIDLSVYLDSNDDVPDDLISITAEGTTKQ